MRRVALAVDGTPADLAPRLAEHVVQAKLRQFGYDDLDGAVGRAAGPGGGRPAESLAEGSRSPRHLTTRPDEPRR